jgi:Spy/CpxP family protein refolding chaperone
MSTSEAAADSAEPLPVRSTAQLRDLAASAARVFGWDKGGTTVHADKALVVTTEQLQQMRELCDADDTNKKPAISERDAISAITTDEQSDEH